MSLEVATLGTNSWRHLAGAMVIRPLRHQLCCVLLIAAFGCQFSVVKSSKEHHQGSIHTSGIQNSRELVTARNLTQAQSESMAGSLITSWGLDKEHHFVQLADQQVSLEDVISSPAAYSAVLVVLPGTSPPVRPKLGAGAPFLSIAAQTPENWMLQALPLFQINKAAAAASSALGFGLYPLSLEIIRLNSTGRGPWILYDVSSGSVHLDARVLSSMQQLPLDLSAYIAEYAVQLFSSLSAAPNALKQASNSTALGGIISTAASATGVAMASQVPLWYCFTCPIVLGMLFPFVFNFGLGKAADELCQIYSLPTEQCNELWYSAFALAMVLSFASVLPIVSICRLAQCARPASPSLT